MLFGSLCRLSDGRRFLYSNAPSLPAGETPTSHFQKAHVTVTPFAQGQLQEVAARSGELECPVCFEPRPDVVTSCGHFFCGPCLSRILLVQRRCPTCRTDLEPRNLVSLAPSSGGIFNEYLQFLWDYLSQRQGQRTAVLASWSKMHEELAASFRRRGLRRCWAWRGDADALSRVYALFQEPEDAQFRRDGGGGCLFVDPSELRWEHFSRVSEALILWPLNDGPTSLRVCCQIRKARTALPGARFTALAREGQQDVQDVSVECVGRHPFSLQCSSTYMQSTSFPSPA